MPERLGGEADPEVQQHEDGCAAGDGHRSQEADKPQAVHLDDIARRVDVLARVRVLLKSLDARRLAKCPKERHENEGR